MIIQVPEEPLTLQTRTGRIVQFQPGLRIAPQELAPQNRIIREKYPEGLQSTLRKEPTGMYNCHGLTFTSRRGFLGEEQDVDLILGDDEYHNVELGAVCPGDIILYYEQNELQHSGIVVAVSQNERPRIPWIMSKWGTLGEYIHRYNYCPYDCQDVRYMREGRND